jgi:hypothetical protein
MSILKQRCAAINLQKTFRFRQNLQTFTIIVNNHPRISGKMGFTSEEKAFLLECIFE